MRQSWRASGGAGKIADLTWIDDRQRKAGAGQSGSHGGLEPAGGLEHNQGRSQGKQIGDELRKGLEGGLIPNRCSCP